MSVFVENWFTDESCATLAALIRTVEDVPGRIIEIGSWEGRSTIAIADATARLVHAVDTWQGSATDRYQREQVKTRDVYGAWLANIDDRPNVIAYPMDWREYLAVESGPVALVFIDADHTEPEVSAQIQAFKPIMSPGGIICGDDYPMRPVARAVRRHLRYRVTVAGRVWSWQAP